MNSKQYTTIPLSGQKRILELDVIRGFAVLGIFWVNIVIFAQPSSYFGYPLAIGAHVELNLVAWAVSELFISGSMYALFSMLFGASALILLSDSGSRSSSDVEMVNRYYRRNVLLMVFGLIHSFLLLWPFEILFTYGLLGMLLFPLRHVPAKHLLFSGLLLVGTGSAEFNLASMWNETHEENSQGEFALNETHADYDSETIVEGTVDDVVFLNEPDDEQVMDALAQDAMDLYSSSYAEIFRFQFDSVINSHSYSIFTSDFFDSGGMMLIGMALFRLGVLSGERSLLFYTVLSIIGYASALALRVPVVNEAITSGFAPFSAEQLSLTSYLFARLPLALGHLGLIIILCRLRPFTLIAKAWAAVGKLALTNYVSQTLFAILVFFGFGLNYFGAFGRWELALICLAFFCFQTVLSLAWLKYFRFGPLEWVLRSLAYGTAQPMRYVKTRSVEPVAP